MRFTSPAMTGALRAVSQARMANQKQVFARQYTTSQTPKKSGSKILVAALVGAGIIGGISYNSSETKVLPVVKTIQEKVAAFKSSSFVTLTLAEVQPINHDTSLFRFELPKDQVAGLPVASCVVFKHAVEGGKPIIRPYTPVSKPEAEGHVDFVIKKYDDGKFTPILFNMKPGETLDIKGPIPKYDWEKEPKTNVGMIAGGTGITPMLQIIRHIFGENSTDNKTKVSLIFANQTEQDILLKDELDKIAKENPDRFKVAYGLDKAPEGWTGFTGYVNAEVVKANLPSPEQDDTIIFVCGPPPMVKSLAGVRTMKSQGELEGVLKELGYEQKNVFKF